MYDQFIQDGPQFGNLLTEDPSLKNFLEWRLPDSVLKEIEPDLKQFGERVSGDIYELSIDAEDNPPVHIPLDAWGNRIDEIKVSRGWQELDRISAEEGLIAIGYERRQKEFSRSYQFAKLFLFHPSSAFYSCPLAMTDGAARLIEVYGDDKLKKGPFAHLTSRDPEKFWTSGQWMTEKTGGSDVSGTSTVAKKKGSQFELYGTKWFTSAATAQMALALGRIEGDPQGNRGLSVFFVQLRDKENKLQNIKIHRLKDKLGTNALPTAEMDLEGVPAWLVGDSGNGVKKIAVLLNITRLYNSVCALATMARCLAIARDYSRKRKAFGSILKDLPLHLETLSDLQLEYQGNFLLTFQATYLLGKEEVGAASTTESQILRMLTPIVKLYTARYATLIASETLEVFGGVGYMEDSRIPRLFRDAQVFSLWEGTTNVLSLDMIRAMQKENAFEGFVQDIKLRLSAIQLDDFSKEKCLLEEDLQELIGFVGKALKKGPDYIQASARLLAFSCARVWIGGLMLEHGQWEEKMPGRSGRLVLFAKRWFRKPRVVLNDPSEEHQKENRKLVFD